MTKQLLRLAVSGVLPVLLLACGAASSAPELTQGEADARDAYLAYRAERDRLDRLPRDERDLTLVRTLVTPEYAEILEGWFFQQPDYIDRSNSPNSYRPEVVSSTASEVSFSDCRTVRSEMYRPATSDLVTDGSPVRIGYVATVERVDGRWLVSSDQFDQRQCS